MWGCDNAKCARFVVRKYIMLLTGRYCHFTNYGLAVYSRFKISCFLACWVRNSCSMMPFATMFVKCLTRRWTVSENLIPYGQFLAFSCHVLFSLSTDENHSQDTWYPLLGSTVLPCDALAIIIWKNVLGYLFVVTKLFEYALADIYWYFLLPLQNSSDRQRHHVLYEANHCAGCTDSCSFWPGSQVSDDCKPCSYCLIKPFIT